MARESTQHKLDRVRPPRVQITYDVEVGNAIVKKEIPFVLGVIADLSGKPKEALPKLSDPKRKFVEIDRDNINAVMKGMKPRVTFQVENKLPNQEKNTMGVELTFSNMEDFEPEQIVRKVEPLRRLLEKREQLSALLAKADGNDKLNDRLREILDNTEELQRLGKSAGIETPSGEGSKSK